jgi:hypothetical protein
MPNNLIKYKKQINVEKVLEFSKLLSSAGEDGYIKIGENILEPLTNDLGFLTSIEDIIELSDKNILAIGTDGDIAIYIYKKNEDTYVLKKLKTKIYDDCLYYILKTNEAEKTFDIIGEKKIVYNVSYSD